MVYNREYYQQNKEKFLEWQRIYRKKNRDIILEKRRLYDKQNKEHQTNLKKIWKENNIENVRRQKKKDDKKYHEKNKNNPIFKEKMKLRSQRHYQKLKNGNYEELLLRWRKYHKNNPRSSTSYSLEVQLAMNNVRKRDNNTCQWYGCGLTSRQAPIHVHHIFPRSEYPELELVEQYMICYCTNHHHLWHRYRGDKCASLISTKHNEGETMTILNEVGTDLD